MRVKEECHVRADEREGKQEKARVEGREESEAKRERERKKKERAREKERARTRTVEIVYMRWEGNANGM